MDLSMLTVVGPKCCNQCNVNMSNLSKDIQKYLKLIVAITCGNGCMVAQKCARLIQNKPFFLYACIEKTKVVKTFSVMRENGFYRPFNVV